MTSILHWVTAKLASVSRIRRIRRPTRVNRPDVTPEDAAIMDRVKPYTMTSDARLLALIDAVRYISKCKIPGAIVECGVWKGGSTMAAALTLLAVQDASRDIYLYDTFDGMNPPTLADQTWDGITAADELRKTPARTGIWCYAGLDEVRANMAITGYPPNQLRFVQGSVEQTIPGTRPGEIAILRLDTDWYESTRWELTHLFPLLSLGGVLIIDDYGHWKGARLAADEYFSRENAYSIMLHRIDYTGRIGIKCPCAT